MMSWDLIMKLTNESYVNNQTTCQISERFFLIFPTLLRRPLIINPFGGELNTRTNDVINSKLYLWVQWHKKKCFYSEYRSQFFCFYFCQHMCRLCVCIWIIIQLNRTHTAWWEEGRTAKRWYWKAYWILLLKRHKFLVNAFCPWIKLNETEYT